jgi:2-polyprenyl-3-methyl-5-hydroxy-6-metoxy-1,4-benzoquinol methylase
MKIMENSELFYRHYDALFRHKDYAREIDLIFKLAQKFGVLQPTHMLEIGCGTGNHTQELAKSGIPLTAIDIDKKMITLAREKLVRNNFNHVRFSTARIDRLAEKNFDLIVAFFNVVTYIPDDVQLKIFMAGVAKRLAPDGIFIFDCWNGVAVLRDPPHTKTIRMNQHGARIVCKLDAHTDAFNQKTLLTYRFSVHHDKKTETGNYAFMQTLWTPTQITAALAQAGLELLLCSPFMKPSKPARATDWKIIFCCRKPRYKPQRSKN